MCDARENDDGVGDGHGFAHASIEGFSAEPFHGDPGVCLGLAVGDISDDVGMLKLGEDFGFARKTFAICFFFVEENFDGDGLIGREIERAKNACHPALSDEGFEAKALAHDVPDLHAKRSIVANEVKGPETKSKIWLWLNRRVRSKRTDRG